MGEWLFTCQPDAEQAALAELRACAPGFRVTRMHAAGVGQFAANVPAGGWGRAPLIFTRHVCPVDALADWTDDTEGHIYRYIHNDIRVKLAEIGLLGEALAVQLRAIGVPPAGCRERAVAAIGDALSGAGVRRADAAPWALSVGIARSGVLLGLSRTADNRSPWPGGCRPFGRTDGMVCRSEFKLLEALEVFGVEVPSGGSALDLGAAPGGWTRVLASRGMRVTAVDPAELDGRVARDSRVTHVKATAQPYIMTSADESFDMIVNDMKMDAEISADIMVKAARLLRPGGLAALTLKLAAAGHIGKIRAARRILEGEYAVRNIRQLFHNRSEVTCLLSRREG